jgi:hypothetical protein
MLTGKRSNTCTTLDVCTPVRLVDGLFAVASAPHEVAVAVVVGCTCEGAISALGLLSVDE